MPRTIIALNNSTLDGRPSSLIASASSNTYSHDPYMKSSPSTPKTAPPQHHQQQQVSHVTDSYAQYHVDPQQQQQMQVPNYGSQGGYLPSPAFQNQEQSQLQYSYNQNHHQQPQQYQQHSSSSMYPSESSQHSFYASDKSNPGSEEDVQSQGSANCGNSFNNSNNNYSTGSYIGYPPNQPNSVSATCNNSECNFGGNCSTFDETASIHSQSTCATNTRSATTANRSTKGHVRPMGTDRQDRGRVDPSRFKTEQCSYYVRGEACPYSPFCAFAHGDEERRSRRRNIREGVTKVNTLPRHMVYHEVWIQTTKYTRKTGPTDGNRSPASAAPSPQGKPPAAPSFFKSQRPADE